MGRPSAVDAPESLHSAAPVRDSGPDTRDSAQHILFFRFLYQLMDDWSVAYGKEKDEYRCPALFHRLSTLGTYGKHRQEANHPFSWSSVMWTVESVESVGQIELLDGATIFFVQSLCNATDKIRRKRKKT